MLPRITITSPRRAAAMPIAIMKTGRYSAARIWEGSCGMSGHILVHRYLTNPAPAAPKIPQPISKYPILYHLLFTVSIIGVSESEELELASLSSPPLISSSVDTEKSLARATIFSNSGTDSPNSHLEMDWRETLSSYANCSWDMPCFFRKLLIFSPNVIYDTSWIEY